MKKSIQDLKESLRKKEEKQQRLHEQEETVKKDIRVLRYLIAKEEEAASPQAPGNEKSPKADKRLFYPDLHVLRRSAKAPEPAHHLSLLLPLALHPLRVRITLSRPPQTVALHDTGVF